jgi:hypothetical protein
MHPPSDDAAAGLTLPPVRAVPIGRPFHWLRLGWRDFTRAFGPSVFHGLVVAAGGLAIVALSLSFWYLLPGAVSGFLLVGPILATGLYEISRRLEQGARPTLADVFAAWRRGTRPLVFLGLALMIAGTLWVLVSLVLIALFVTAPITDLASFLRGVHGRVRAAAARPGHRSHERHCNKRAGGCREPARHGALVDPDRHRNGPRDRDVHAGLHRRDPGDRARDLARVSRRGGGGRTTSAHLIGQPSRSALFGFTEEQISEFALTYGLGAFVLFMLFIIWDLARKSKAGRLGTFILFFVLAFGILGFVAKQVIQWLLGL